MRTRSTRPSRSSRSTSARSTFGGSPHDSDSARSKPTHEYGVWALRRAGELRAYVVTKRGELYGNASLIVMDLGCRRGEEQALLRLLAARLAAERTAGAAAAVVTGLHPFFAQLRRL